MSQSRLVSLTCAAALMALTTNAASANTQEDQTSVSATPPIAEKREHTYTHHGITISDPYDWLYDKSYPTIDDEDVLDYVKAENAYFEAKMAGQEELTESLFKEMRARIKEDDSTVPQRSGNYMYWSEFEEGAQYRKHYRKAVGASEGAEPQLILDQNALAEGL
ncbi:MAG: S9 family peptidase, partial [Erythrobacter sp.]